MDDCKLSLMFQKRLDFINEMKATLPGSYPDFPVDLTNKKSQQVCRDLALKGVEEMFEALQHLKNWKPHRQTDLSGEEVNKEEFLEEVVDALNYFFAMLIVTGINHEELFESYVRKHDIITERLKNGY